MIPFDLPPALVCPTPAIIRPAEHSILRPGYFQPVRPIERRAIIADLVRSRRLTPKQAKRAMLLVPVVGWKPKAGGIGNDEFTVLLIHCDGTDGSKIFTDVSTSSHTVTANGGAEVDTAQSVFGGGSCRLPGSNDYLSVASHADFAFGTGDFSVDLWIKFISASGEQEILGCNVSGGFSLYKTSSGNMAVSHAYVGGDMNVSWSPSSGIWYHIATTRISGTMRLFSQGVQIGSSPVTTNYAQGQLRIGKIVNHDVNGWIDEIRVSKGIGRWDSAFTPQTQPYG